MRVVARPEALEALRERGDVYLWARAVRCCRSHQYVLEASLDRPAGEFEFVHAADGVQVHTTPGLIKPDELHLELDRKGRVRAYWNNQAWIG